MYYLIPYEGVIIWKFIFVYIFCLCNNFIYSTQVSSPKLIHSLFSNIFRVATSTNSWRMVTSNSITKPSLSHMNVHMFLLDLLWSTSRVVASTYSLQPWTLYSLLVDIFWFCLKMWRSNKTLWNDTSTSSVG